jgi:superfamily I DNA and/or RNA helicase
MPPQLGDFVSKLVYDDKLLSNPRHPAKKSINACHFIDVVGGKETFSGKSYMVCSFLPEFLFVSHYFHDLSQNPLEIQAVVTIARQLENDGKRYRIITPYDAQRNKLEESMKTENLQWEDKCFNVDSFQGLLYIFSLFTHSRSTHLKEMKRTTSLYLLSDPENLDF